MRLSKRYLSLFMTVLMITLFFMIPVSAGGTYEPTSNYVSAGGYFSAGGLGSEYCLRANSSNTTLGAAVSTRWHA